MDLDIILNYFNETSDRLFPFIRNFKVYSHLHELSQYIKINLKPNINIHELESEVYANILLVTDKLEFISFNNKYNKYICLIKHKDGYEILNIKQKYLIHQNELSNIKIHFLTKFNIDDDDDDDDEDYKEIENNITIDDEFIVHTEDLKSVNDIIKKELVNDINEIITETIEIDNTFLENIKEEIHTNKQSEEVKNKLNKMIKEKLIEIIMNNNSSTKKSMLNKNTKDKLIDMIIKNGYKY
jgi:hypothetical protein